VQRVHISGNRGKGFDIPRLGTARKLGEIPDIRAPFDYPGPAVRLLGVARISENAFYIESKIKMLSDTAEISS
jgi:hypothetical protein